MSNREALLSIDPPGVQFPFELRKEIRCVLTLTNHTDNNVAFRVMTRTKDKYLASSNTGIILAKSSFQVALSMLPQEEAPPDLTCEDKFVLQAVIATPEADEVTPEMFIIQPGNLVEEKVLNVTYVAPPPIHQGSELGKLTEEQFNNMRALITKLTQEQESAIQLNNIREREMGNLTVIAPERYEGQCHLWHCPVCVVPHCCPDHKVLCDRGETIASAAVIVDGIEELPQEMASYKSLVRMANHETCGIPNLGTNGLLQKPWDHPELFNADYRVTEMKRSWVFVAPANAPENIPWRSYGRQGCETVVERVGEGNNILRRSWNTKDKAPEGLTFTLTRYKLSESGKEFETAVYWVHAERGFTKGKKHKGMGGTQGK